MIHNTSLLVANISIVHICKVNMFQGKVMDLFNLFVQLNLLRLQPRACSINPGVV